MHRQRQEPPKQLRRVAALAGATTADEPSVKAMNNYLGIGIDAKVGFLRCPHVSVHHGFCLLITV